MPYGPATRRAPGVPATGIRGTLVARRPRNRRRRPNADQRRFLADLERSVRSIVHPVDNAAVYHLQVQYVLDRDGFYVVREVPVMGKHRVDLVVMRNGVTAAMEMDRFNPRSVTYDKFESLPDDVLRVLVLRRRHTAISMSWADLTVCERATLKMVSWLSDGRTTDMSSIDASHRSRADVIPLREELLAPGRVGTVHARRR